MKRVLHTSAKPVATSLLTAGAAWMILAAFALAGGSPLFNADNESAGVKKNNEVLVGIANTGRAVAQKGASLSDQHFLFKEQNEKSKSESAAQAGPGPISNHGGVAGIQGTGADGQRIARQGSQRGNVAGGCSPTAPLGTADPQISKQLTYGYFKNPIDSVAQDDQASGSSTAGFSVSGSKVQNNEAEIFRATQYTSGTACLGHLGNWPCDRFDGRTRTFLQSGEGVVFVPKIQKAVKRSRIRLGGPDGGEARIRHPAIHVSPYPHCSYCSGGQPPQPYFQGGVDV